MIYHHTSLAHLPFILTEGALVASPQRAGWPRDFIWATTDERGDRTAGICDNQRRHKIPHVRIGLKRDRFVPWLEQAAISWVGEFVDELIDLAREMGQHDTTGWWAAEDRVADDQFLSIEMQTWDTPWRDIKVEKLISLQNKYFGFEAGGRSWAVTRREAHTGGPLLYICMPQEMFDG